jgi:hypothetical protein
MTTPKKFVRTFRTRGSTWARERPTRFHKVFPFIYKSNSDILSGGLKEATLTWRHVVVRTSASRYAPPKVPEVFIYIRVYEYSYKGIIRPPSLESSVIRQAVPESDHKTKFIFFYFYLLVRVHTMTGTFNLAQSRALAIAPKISGSLGFAFSLLIVASVVRDKKRRGSTYDRLLVGISCVDMNSSFWYVMSTWPIPKSSTVLWAVGNDATCTLQGFLSHLVIASSFYNASLTLYYLLTIRYGWKQDRIRKIEPLLHAVPLTWGIGTSFTGLGLGIFGDAMLWCWIPKKYGFYRWLLFYWPLWTMIVLVTVMSFMIYLHVRKAERQAIKYMYGARLSAASSWMSSVSDPSLKLSRPASVDEGDSKELEEVYNGEVVDSIELEEAPHGCVVTPSQVEVDFSHADPMTDCLATETVTADTKDTNMEFTKLGTLTIQADVENGDLLVQPPSANRSASCDEARFPSTLAVSSQDRDISLEDAKTAIRPASLRQVKQAISNRFTRSSVSTNNETSHLRHTREVASQCFWYAGAFYFNWTALSVSIMSYILAALCLSAMSIPEKNVRSLDISIATGHQW